MAARNFRGRQSTSGITIMNQVRYRECVICKLQLPESPKALGVNNCLKLWLDYGIATDPYLDKICNDCDNTPHHKIIASPNLYTCNGSDQRGQRPFNNMVSVLKALTFDRKTMIDNHRRVLAIANDHSNCVIKYETVNPQQCETLTKLSRGQIDEIAMDILLEMKEQDLDINESLKAIDKSYKNDIALNDIEWPYITEDNAVDIGNWNSANSETYILKRIRECLFLFYVKSITCNNYEIMGIYHSKGEQAIRRHFHRGRVLLHTFWMPKYNGFTHINALDIHRHRNPYTEILDEILHKKIACCVDGHELRQDRYFDFNASYLSSSYKGYNTRKWMGFVLYVLHFSLTLFTSLHPSAVLAKFLLPESCKRFEATQIH